MPLYEYECDSCGHRFELIVKFSDPPVTTCPVCAGPVHKLFSSPAFQFKGTGWYVTDYAKKEHVPGGKTPSNDSAAKDTGESSGEKGGGERAEKGDKAGSSTEASSASSTASTPSTSGDAKSAGDSKSGGDAKKA